jgi:hypothetical protein
MNLRNMEFARNMPILARFWRDSTQAFQLEIEVLTS